MSTLTRFWIVFNTSKTPEKINFYRHATLEDAKKEAKRLAAAQEDQQFAVMECVAAYVRETAKELQILPEDYFDDGMPF